MWRFFCVFWPKSAPLVPSRPHRIARTQNIKKIRVVNFLMVLYTIRVLIFSHFWTLLVDLLNFLLKKSFKSQCEKHYLQITGRIFRIATKFWNLIIRLRFFFAINFISSLVFRYAFRFLTAFLSFAVEGGTLTLDHPVDAWLVSKW